MSKSKMILSAKSNLAYMMHMLDEDILKFDNDLFVKSWRDKIIGAAMVLHWCDILTEEEFDMINICIPFNKKEYNALKNEFVRVYKYLGGEYLESMD